MLLTILFANLSDLNKCAKKDKLLPDFRQCPGACGECRYVGMCEADHLDGGGPRDCTAGLLARPHVAAASGASASCDLLSSSSGFRAGRSGCSSHTPEGMIKFL